MKNGIVLLRFDVVISSLYVQKSTARKAPKWVYILWDIA